MRRIGGVLGRSAFGPTHEHLLKVIGCLDLLPALADAAVKGDREGVDRAAREIHRLELEADAIKSAIRMQFTTSFLASVSRSELLALVKAQDDVADDCDRLAFELSVRPTRFPPHLADEITNLISKISGAGRPLGEVSRILDACGGRVCSADVAKVSPLLEDVMRLVGDAEPLYEGLLRRLFEREGESAPLDVFFVMRFAERAERAAGKIENVHDVLTRLVLERKE